MVAPYTMPAHMDLPTYTGAPEPAQVAVTDTVEPTALALWDSKTRWGAGLGRARAGAELGADPGSVMVSGTSNRANPRDTCTVTVCGPALRMGSQVMQPGESLTTSGQGPDPTRTNVSSGSGSEPSEVKLPHMLSLEPSSDMG